MGVNSIAREIIHEIRFENNRFVHHIKGKESQGVVQNGFKLRRVLINVKDGYSRASEPMVKVIFRKQKWKRNGSACRHTGCSDKKVATSEDHNSTPKADKLL